MPFAQKYCPNLLVWLVKRLYEFPVSSVQISITSLLKEVSPWYWRS